MTRQKPSDTTVRTVSLIWYVVALVPIALFAIAPLLGWLPLLALPFGLFFIFFWIFSFGFAVYAKLKKPKEPRQ